MGRLIKDGIPFTGSSGSADMVKYDNKNSGLTALTAQDAIDEVNVNLNHRPVNNNILINSNFANPVNQRGVTAESWSTNGGYGLDRWIPHVSQIVSIDGGVKFKPLYASGGGIYQNIDLKSLPATPISISACINGVVYSANNTVNANLKTDEFFTIDDVILVVGTKNFDIHKFIYVGVYGTNTSKEYNVEWVKAEFGSVATPYVPRLYAEELQLCKRYYRRITLHDSLPFIKSNDTLAFEKTYDKLRIDFPTVSIEGCGIRNNSTFVDGFTFSALSYNGFVDLVAEKASHGLSNSTSVQIVGTMILDAEL